MSRNRNTFWSVLLPLLISVTLSISAYFLMLERFKNAQRLNLGEECPEPWTGAQHYQRKYLGGYAPQLEQFLCNMVLFFDPLFKPEASHTSPFFYDLLIAVVVPITIPLLEACRTERPLAVAFPLAVHLLFQLGIGIFLPLYWGLFLATTHRKDIGTHIDQASAEAVLFGIAMGFCLPTFVMGYFPTVESIAIWIGFPLYISVFQYLHLLIRPRRSHPESGYHTVQATWILIFFVSTFFHVHALSAYHFDPEVIIHAFFPTIAEPKNTTPLTSSHHSLQWDMAFIFGSTFLTSLWFAENILQGALLVVWSAVSSILLGPAAAVAGIFLWRERKLEHERGVVATATKLSKAR